MPTDRDFSAKIPALTEAGLGGRPVGRDDAASILRGGSDLLPLVHAAGVVRRRWCGRGVQIHILNNVQNGACPEDCGYCGQSKDSEAPVQAYKLKSRGEILAEAASAKANGAHRYCMVLSGRGPSDGDIEHMAACIREVKATFGLETCLSSGLLDEPKARRLKEAGLDRLNHNINTSARHYPAICTTHTYEDRKRTLHAARGAGLELCSGIIVGMGETHDDLLDAVYTLRELGAESIPVNFLVPIPGNRVRRPLCGDAPLTPEFCLRVLCAVRLINPAAEVRAAAGRERHLRSLQALALEPANSLFVDGYLLTKGGGAAETVKMIRDAGYEVTVKGGVPEALRRLLEEAASDDAGAEMSSLKEDRLSARKLAKLRVNGVDAAF